MDDQLISVYLHLPFCHHICSYCDLNAYAGVNHVMPHYVKALVKEINGVAALGGATHYDGRASNGFGSFPTECYK